MPSRFLLGPRVTAMRHDLAPVFPSVYQFLHVAPLNITRFVWRVASESTAIVGKAKGPNRPFVVAVPYLSLGMVVLFRLVVSSEEPLGKATSRGSRDPTGETPFVPWRTVVKPRSSLPPLMNIQHFHSLTACIVQSSSQASCWCLRRSRGCGRVSEAFGDIVSKIGSTNAWHGIRDHSLMSQVQRKCFHLVGGCREGLSEFVTICCSRRRQGRGIDGSGAIQRTWNKPWNLGAMKVTMQCFRLDCASATTTCPITSGAALPQNATMI